MEQTYIWWFSFSIETHHDTIFGICYIILMILGVFFDRVSLCASQASCELDSFLYLHNNFGDCNYMVPYLAS